MELSAVSCGCPIWWHSEETPHQRQAPVFWQRCHRQHTQESFSLITLHVIQIQAEREPRQNFINPFPQTAVIAHFRLLHAYAKHRSIQQKQGKHFRIRLSVILDDRCKSSRLQQQAAHKCQPERGWQTAYDSFRNDRVPALQHDGRCQVIQVSTIKACPADSRYCPKYQNRRHK